MPGLRKIDRPAILEIDIAGESLVLGIEDIKDALAIFDILERNAYNVTIKAVSKGDSKDDPIRVSKVTKETSD